MYRRVAGQMFLFDYNSGELFFRPIIYLYVYRSTPTNDNERARIISVRYSNVNCDPSIAAYETVDR